MYRCANRHVISLWLLYLVLDLYCGAGFTRCLNNISKSISKLLCFNIIRTTLINVNVVPLNLAFLSINSKNEVTEKDIRF